MGGGRYKVSSTLELLLIATTNFSDLGHYKLK